MLSQSCKPSSSSLVVPKLRVSRLSFPPGPWTRTHAVKVALCTSIPQQRRCTRFIVSLLCAGARGHTHIKRLCSACSKQQCGVPPYALLSISPTDSQVPMGGTTLIAPVQGHYTSIFI